MSWNLVGFMANSATIVHKMEVWRQAERPERTLVRNLKFLPFRCSPAVLRQLTGLGVSCKLFELCGFPFMEASGPHPRRVQFIPFHRVR